MSASLSVGPFVDIMNNSEYLNSPLMEFIEIVYIYCSNYFSADEHFYGHDNDGESKNNLFRYNCHLAKL